MEIKFPDKQAFMMGFKFPISGNLNVMVGRAIAGMHFKVCMLRENSRRVDQENETVSF